MYKEAVAKQLLCRLLNLKMISFFGLCGNFVIYM